MRLRSEYPDRLLVHRESSSRQQVLSFEVAQAIGVTNRATIRRLILMIMTISPELMELGDTMHI